MALKHTVGMVLAAAMMLAVRAAHAGDATGTMPTVGAGAGSGNAGITANQGANGAAGKHSLYAEPRPQYWFGVAVENIPPGFAKQLKLKADQGLMVIAVLPDSPA